MPEIYIALAHDFRLEFSAPHSNGTNRFQAQDDANASDVSAYTVCKDISCREACKKQQEERLSQAQAMSLTGPPLS